VCLRSLAFNEANSLDDAGRGQASEYAADPPWVLLGHCAQFTAKIVRSCLALSQEHMKKHVFRPLNEISAGGLDRVQGFVSSRTALAFGRRFVRMTHSIFSRRRSGPD
jgi:hypothetical protein